MGKGEGVEERDEEGDVMEGGGEDVDGCGVDEEDVKKAVASLCEDSPFGFVGFEKNV